MGYSQPPLMSLNETEMHRLWVCAFATAASKSDVNVTIPHLRGKGSPTLTHYTSLSSSPNITWDLTPQVTQPIFTAGRIKSNVQLAEAERERALVQYERRFKQRSRKRPML